MLNLQPSLSAQFDLNNHIKACDQLSREDAIQLLKSVLYQNAAQRAALISLLNQGSL